MAALGISCGRAKFGDVIVLRRGGVLVALAVAIGMMRAQGVTECEVIDKKKFYASKRCAETEFRDGPKGLKYREVKIGEGKTATKGSLCTVHYEGKSLSGSRMECTFKNSLTGIRFYCGSPQPTVAAFLNEGVVGMREGGHREMIVPPHMHYPERWPNRILIYEVSLMRVRGGEGNEEADAVEKEEFDNMPWLAKIVVSTYLFIRDEQGSSSEFISSSSPYASMVSADIRAARSPGSPSRKEGRREWYRSVEINGKDMGRSLSVSDDDESLGGYPRKGKGKGKGKAWLGVPYWKGKGYKGKGRYAVLGKGKGWQDGQDRGANYWRGTGFYVAKNKGSPMRKGKGWRDEQDSGWRVGKGKGKGRSDDYASESDMGSGADEELGNDKRKQDEQDSPKAPSEEKNRTRSAGSGFEKDIQRRGKGGKGRFYALGKGKGWQGEQDFPRKGKGKGYGFYVGHYPKGGKGYYTPWGKGKGYLPRWKGKGKGVAAQSDSESEAESDTEAMGKGGKGRYIALGKGKGRQDYQEFSRFGKGKGYWVVPAKGKGKGWGYAPPVWGKGFYYEAVPARKGKGIMGRGYRGEDD
ncbi:hypothetical protein FOZ61_006882 [Perkinsus olseni]|uniref:peptidylprolyl isomerase n=1 Tax=Perkinsus olseni TaxID=32597 RepID=A0A7J6M9P5_PEROL|nr:hypothetical protein FOZ61_006882 [Perkinsus olseni]KAF4673736.1 hypothetical protein FOL46_006594 [Perkinsus olseni]